MKTSLGTLKILIDTGSNKSYIKPQYAVNPSKFSHKQIVKSANRDIEVFEFVKFNPFPESKYSYDEEFTLFNFNDEFDGLIGYEFLKKTKCKIDAEKNILEFNDKKIKMKNKILNNFDANEGDFLIDKMHFLNENLAIAPGLYKLKNNKSTCLLFNKKDNSYKLKNILLNIGLCQIETNNFLMTNNNNINNLNFEKNNDFEYFNNDEILTNLRTDHLNLEEKQNLIKLICDFRDCFPNSDKLSFTNAIKHEIKTKDDTPVHTKSYRYPYAMKEEIRKQIDDLIDNGIIVPSISPWTSPVWVVKKKEDASGKEKWRMVIDYRKLNAKTIDDKYPIPNITDILDKLGKAQYFSTIDLKSGYHQIEMNENDRQKTAFSVENGHYEFLRMPFGLKNAPATFQRIMDTIFRELIGVCIFVFMDDIIIFSPSLKQHLIDLKKVFEILKKYNLKAQIDKSEFLRKEIEFLGHVVTEEGVKPNPKKIEVIKNFPIPRTERDLRAYLGILGYYRRHIKDFAKIFKPLTNQLRKESKGIIHTKEFVEAFEKGKNVLTSNDILIYPDFSKPFILTTDASNYAIGACLSQGKVGQDRPISFASRTLNKTEERYSTIEKELLAINWAIKHYRAYLWGRKFKLYTDHKPLTYIFNLKTPNSKLIRWKLDLEEYDYEIIHKPGKQNVVADALSRVNCELNYNLRNRKVDSTMATVHSAESDDSNFIKMTTLPVNTFSNQIIFSIDDEENISSKYIFPRILRISVIKSNYEINDIKNILMEYLDYKKLNCIYSKSEKLIGLIQKVYNEYFSNNKNLKIVISQKFCIDIITLEEEDKIIKDVHERAHRGADENLKCISEKYFFQNMKKKIQRYVKLCEICKKNKYERHPYKLKILETPIGKKPFEIVHVDIFFASPCMWLSFVDSFSRFGGLIPIQSRTIIDVKNALITLFSTYTQPKILISDNESSIRSYDIRGLLNDLDIELLNTPSDRSKTNGKVERFHSTITEIFRCIKEKFKNLTVSEIYQIAVSEYNNTIHSATNIRPVELFLAIKVNEKGEIKNLIEQSKEIYDRVSFELKERQRKIYDRVNKKREDTPKFEKNEKIYIKRAGIKKKIEPAFIENEIKEINKNTIIDSKNRKIHIENIKRK